MVALLGRCILLGSRAFALAPGMPQHYQNKDGSTKPHLFVVGGKCWRCTMGLNTHKHTPERHHHQEAAQRGTLAPTPATGAGRQRSTPGRVTTKSIAWWPTCGASNHGSPSETKPTRASKGLMPFVPTEAQEARWPAQSTPYLPKWTSVGTRLKPSSHSDRKERHYSSLKVLGFQYSLRYL